MSVRHCLSLAAASSHLVNGTRAPLLALALAVSSIPGISGHAATALSDQDMAIRAMTFAQKLVNAMERGDAETAATMTDLNALAAVGGVEGLKDSLRKQIDAGVRCSITGVPSLAADAGFLYVIVTTKTLLKQAGEQATIYSYLVGSSKDNGRTWRFLNGSEKAKERLTTASPSLADALSFPVRTMRVSDSTYTETNGRWVPDASTRADMSRSPGKRASQGASAALPPSSAITPSPAVAQPSAADIQRWRQAAANGDAVAQFNLGDAYTHGKVVDKNAEEAMKWYRKSAEQGHAAAQWRLGTAYTLAIGVEENEENLQEGVRWLRRSAEQGYTEAQFSLGAVSTGPERGRWLRKAADQGHEAAQSLLASGVLPGLETISAEDVKWYRKFSELGHARAQLRLGLAYAEGLGVQKDYSEVEKWFLRAASQGNVEAQCRLGGFYVTVEKNYPEAVKWYRKAAEQGNAKAQYSLGLFYESGLGVVKDFGDSYRWLLLAAAGGSPEALSEMGTVEKSLSSSEQQEARSWAKQWKPQPAK